MPKKKTNYRPPPAYLEYASDVLADLNFKMMGLSERGLWISLRLQCWVNKQVPSDPQILARMIGADTQDVDAALSELVLSYFRPDTNGKLITCPELDLYREKLAADSANKSRAGKAGAYARWAKEQGASGKSEIEERNVVPKSSGRRNGIAIPSALTRTADTSSTIFEDDDRASYEAAFDGASDSNDRVASAADQYRRASDGE